MPKLQEYNALYRSTVAEIDTIPDVRGIYVLAYMGRVIYVGKTNNGTTDRIRQHLCRSMSEAVGSWLQSMYADWGNIRLDVLAAPDGDDTWIADAEAALIARFNPLLNMQLI